ncbi:DUF4173 domain-containing protein [Maribacter sp. BPC-D8]|uniref:DUF4153 domain-containing protein n=1 Tax=Maribacter sp. BPC-D8 TaxID=3053613 RepID=UPI002B46E605|nr:DUF4173 domain-containing protein [Maribacter sp. BPC-D8]WRI27912.1 DUF4173 domain-containing protein [Maribacter sp. BPC-D8]
MNVHIKSLLSALAFSLLFYSKSFGLNLFLISILVVVLVSTLKETRTMSWGYALTYIITSIFILINPTGFTIFVHFMALMIFVGKSISSKTSLYLSWLLGFTNLLVASIANFIQRQNSVEEKDVKKETSPKLLNRLKGGFFAGVLLILFAMLYKNANPVFENLVDQISFDFISFPWVFFTFLGYIIFLNILRPLDAQELIAVDASQKNELETPTEIEIIGQKKQLESEHTLGSFIFIALNFLLVFFLVTDGIYLFQKTDISNAEYSASVHQGVYALMFSIVLAIILILYFFRGNLNFYKENTQIKTLTYVWISLNIILIVFTSYKNFTYVEALGLTYKRIGVFVYLLLTLTGLITVYIKVAEVKSFVYLVRTNIATVFAFLVLSAAVPWDKTITYFNLSTLENPDIHYLIDLGDANSIQLYNYANEKEVNYDLKISIQEKYDEYLTLQSEKTWQEFTFAQLAKNDTE